MNRICKLTTIAKSCDETRAIPRESTEYGVASVYLKEAHITRLGTCNLWTIFTVVSAAGRVLFSVYIYRDPTLDVEKSSNFVVPKIDEEESGWPIFFMRTDTGFMNRATWTVCMENFIELSKKLRNEPEERILLLADGAAMHNKLATCELLQPHGMDIVFFPSNTTHFLQPLDGVPFAIFKNRLGSCLRNVKLSQALLPESGKVNLPHLAYICEKESMTPGAIIKSFEERGIWPYSFAKMMANFQIAHGALTDSSAEISEVEQLAKTTILRLTRPDLLMEPVSIPLPPKKNFMVS